MINGSPQFFRTAFAVQRHPRATREELKAFQDAQLRRLLVHAYEQVPYYRKLFDRYRLHPRHVRGIVDLDLIPITSKQDLLARPTPEIVARDESFVARRTWLEQRIQELFQDRWRRGLGLKLHERIAWVSTPSLPGQKDEKATGRALASLGIHPTRRIDGRQSAAEIVQQLETFQPHMLVGPPGRLCRVADHLVSIGREDIRPRILVVGGEVLTSVVSRRLTQGFGVVPIQTYASQELPLMGWECRLSGEIHTCDDACIVEVLHNGQPAGLGEEGEVVVTDLHAHAMPFIRYRLGDVATRGSQQCPCGQPFSTIRAVRGPTIDYLEENAFAALAWTPLPQGGSTPRRQDRCPGPSGG